MTARPVQLGDRVSEVLARDEALVEVFARHSPHFAKLRSVAMRRVMARLVNVGQAAQLAGVSPDLLLRDLNAALGALPAPACTGGAVPPAEPRLAHPATARVVEVDVREDLRAGREPFSRIMSAASTLRDDEVLLLRAIFEPVPLFGVLAKRGLVHEACEHAPDDWSIWFWRASSADAPAAPPARPAVTTPTQAAPDTVWLDVRGLQPPEPLMQTLAALDALPAGHQLVQVNDRVPQLLFPMLAERGYACEADESRADRVLVRIWRPGHA